MESFLLYFLLLLLLFYFFYEIDFWPSSTFFFEFDFDQKWLAFCCVSLREILQKGYFLSSAVFQYQGLCMWIGWV